MTNELQAKIAVSRPSIERTLLTSKSRVFRKSELSSLIAENRRSWGVTGDVQASTLIEYLTSETSLRRIVLPSTYDKSETRFVLGNPSEYEVAVSLRKNAYLSHGSAVFLHALNDQIPRTVYLNYEQTPKPEPKGGLTQAGLDRAFSNNQRKSNLSYFYETDAEIVIINGKSTGQLEVVEMEYEGVALPVTGIERTLIDITVRPAYAGGVFQVLEAYKNASERASANVLVATLKKLNYVYPYHQAIGFYMERAGYRERLWSRLLSLGVNYDFYLAHGLPKKRKYDEKWRLYYPDGF